MSKRILQLPQTSEEGLSYQKSEVLEQIKEIYHSHNEVDGYRNMTVYLTRRDMFIVPRPYINIWNWDCVPLCVRKKPDYHQGKARKIFENKID